MNNLYQKIEHYIPLAKQICRFGIVGLTASLVHFLLVVALVQLTAMKPLIANVFSFSLSFQVSYWGHRLWTFTDTRVNHRVTFPKLLTVQVCNFIANETLFYIFLSLHLPYPLALLITLTILPVFTFVSSKLWVFA